MAALTGQTIAASYEQLLHVDRDGGGNTTTLVDVKDGDNGTTFALKLAQYHAEIRGTTGTGATGAGKLNLATSELTVVDNDVLGRIDFLAPLESSGTDAILAGASIWGEAEDTFAADNNSTALVFATNTSAAATERIRISSAGNVGIGTAVAGSFDSAGNQLVVGSGTGHQGITLHAGTGSTSVIHMADGTSGSASYQGYIYYSHANTDMTFGVSAATRLKLDANSKISLSNNDSNTGNTVFGKSAFNTSSDNASDYNTAIGELAMGTGSVAGAINCVAIGYKALEDITSGDYHIAIGASAMGNATAGEQNIAIGNGAMDAIDGGESYNIAIGTDAMTGVNTDTSAGNIAIGTNALVGGAAAVIGNIAIGHQALDATAGHAQTGTVAIGYQALTSLTSGADNIAIGQNALTGHTTGGANIAIGKGALSGTAGDVDDAPNSSHNIALGYNALGGNWVDATQSNYNIAIGGESQDGALNGALGNVSVGYDGLGANVSGDYNVGLGHNAANVITTGSNNTILGANSDPSANSATNQTTVGYGVTGVGNNSVTLGDADVTAVYMASDGGATVTCSAIGIDMGTTLPSYPIHLNTTDNTPACYMEISTGNQIQLLKSTSGSPEGVDVWFSGITSGGTSNVAYKYRTNADKFKVTSNGAIYSTSTSVTDISSDQRLKKDIVDYTDGLSVIEKLKPRKYKWKNPEYHKDGQQYGFIAQENESIDSSDELELYSVYDIDNDNPESDLLDDGVMNTTSYGTKDAIYISAIQELSKTVQELSAKVAALEAK